MALNVGDDFKHRWLNAPEAVRQTYCDELKFICNLLESDTHIQKWQQQEILLQQRNQHRVEQAYQQRKQEIIAEQKRVAEELKRKRQAELEHALAEKRAQQRADLAANEAQEKLREQQQTEYLKQFAIELQKQTQQFNTNIAKFDVSRAKQFNCESSLIHQPMITPSSHTEDLKTRLELEAEFYIEQTLQQLRDKLKAAAQEEIALILAQQS